MSETNAFTVSNPDLKAKLERLHVSENIDLEQEVLDEIANRAQFLSVVKPAEDSTPDAPKLEFPVLTTSGHGYIFYPIFTDMEELRKWNKEEDVQTAVLTFDSYAEMVAQDSKVHGLVVNPYGANFSIERDMVDYLQVHRAFIGKLAIEQMFQQQSGDEGGVKLSDPDPYPTEMVNATADYMSTNETIRRAWLRLMDNEGEKSYLIIIDAEGSDTYGDFGEVSGAALPHLTDMYLDLMTLEDDFSKKAVEGVEPFYTRK